MLLTSVGNWALPFRQFSSAALSINNGLCNAALPADGCKDRGDQNDGFYGRVCDIIGVAIGRSIGVATATRAIFGK